MDVASYEALAKEAESLGLNKVAANAVVDAYFVGIAETLQYLKVGSDTVYIGDAPALCIPSNVQLSGALLRGVFDGELQKATMYRQLLGPRWKDFQVPLILFPGLMHSFPCKTY